MQLLLGGLVTLATTAIVQIFLIPRVQRRNRALERWEDNVSELITLVHEEWADKLVAFEQAMAMRRAMRVRIARMIEAEPDREEGYGGGLREYEARARAAYVDAYGATNKMLTLQRRCTLIGGEPLYWSTLFMHIAELAVAMTELNPGTGDESCDEAEEVAQLARVHEAHDRVSDVLDQITMPLKPPPVNPVRHLHHRRQARRAVSAEIRKSRRPATPN